MLKDFKQFIAREQLLSPGNSTLIAVSGGKDSVVMAELFYRAGYTFGMAHCNFQLRGVDSDLDETFVAALANKYKVPLFRKRFLTSEMAHSKGVSIQMAARELRYAWFREILQQEGYQSVATAHHIDDQLETFFINLLRSTGIAGLHGILPKQGEIIRPMLFATRQNIDLFALEHGIAFREDKSNDENKYLRNKIRHEIIPVLREIQPDFSVHMTENILRIRDVENIFRETLDKLRKKILIHDAGNTRIPISQIKTLNPAGTYLYELLSPFGFNFSQVKDLLKTLDRTSGKILLSPTHRLLKDRDYIFITPKIFPTGESVNELPVTIPATASSIRRPVRLTFRKIIKDQKFVIDPSPELAFLDRQKLAFPLSIRRWQKGDHFYPFGRNHRKKVSDYFIDEKFSLFEKENTWVLCCGKEIAWIIGHRIDNRFRITAKTKEVLKIKWSK